MQNQKKPKIVMIVSRFPYPLEKGDKLRAFNQIKELSAYYDITLIALSDKDILEEHLAIVQRYCSEVNLFRIHKAMILNGLIRAFFTGKPFQVGYFYHKSIAKAINKLLESDKFSHIYCQLIRTTEYVKDIHTTRKTREYMDALGYGMLKRSEQQPFYKRWLYRMESQRLLRYEQRMFDYFENHSIISEQDRSRITHPERDKILIVPNGIDSTFFDERLHTDLYDLVFVGNMSYPPNVDAVLYLAKTILPQLPDVTLLIAGASPEPAVQKLANERITVTGWIEDIRDAYSSAKVFVAPMRIGTGLQNKLLESMACGTPCITSTLANNALKATDQLNIRIADTEAELIRSIEELLHDDDQRKELAHQARMFVQSSYDWKKSVELLRDAINSSVK